MLGTRGIDAVPRFRRPGPVAGALAGTAIAAAGLAGAARSDAVADAWIDFLSGPGLFLPFLLAVAFVALRRPVLIVWCCLGASAASGFMLAHVGIATESAAQPLIFGLFLAAAWARLTRGAPPPVGRAGLALLGVYLLVSSAMIISAQTLALGFASFREQMLYLLLVPAIALGPWTSDQRRRMLHGAIFVTFAAGLYAMLRYATGPDADEFAVARVTSHTVEGELVLFGSFASRQALCTWAAVIVPALVAIVPVLRPPTRAAAGVGLVCSVVAIPASETRIGLVAVGAGFFVVAALLAVTRIQRPETARALAVLLGLAALGSAAYGLTVTGDEARSGRLGAVLNPGEDFSFERRRAKWRQVVKAINERPIEGYGLGSAGITGRLRGRFVSIDEFQIDNGYLQLAYQQGWPAVVLFIAALLTLATGLTASLLRAPPGVAELRIAAIGALAAWMTLITAGGFFPTGSTMLVALFIGLAMHRGAPSTTSGSPTALV